MFCRYCHQEIEGYIVILPSTTVDEDGCLDTLSCLPCAEKSGLFCLKHSRPHMGFEDGSSACVLCIEETGRALDKNYVIRILQGALPSQNWMMLQSWANFSASFIADTAEACIVRAVVSAAYRSDKTIELIFEEIIAKQTAASILPQEWAILDDSFFEGVMKG